MRTRYALALSGGQKNARRRAINASFVKTPPEHRGPEASPRRDRIADFYQTKPNSTFENKGSQVWTLEIE